MQFCNDKYCSLRFQMTKMIHIQISIRLPYSDGVIRHDLRGWKNVRKSRRNTIGKKQSMKDIC